MSSTTNLGTGFIYCKIPGRPNIPNPIQLYLTEDECKTLKERLSSRLNSFVYGHEETIQVISNLGGSIQVSGLVFSRIWDIIADMRDIKSILHCNGEKIVVSRGDCKMMEDFHTLSVGKKYVGTPLEDLWGKLDSNDQKDLENAVNWLFMRYRRGYHCEYEKLKYLDSFSVSVNVYSFLSKMSSCIKMN